MDFTAQANYVALTQRYQGNSLLPASAKNPWTPPSLCSGGSDFVSSRSHTPCRNPGALEERDFIFLGHHHPGFFHFLERPVLSYLRTLLVACLPFSCPPRTVDSNAIPRSHCNENISTSEKPSWPVYSEQSRSLLLIFLLALGFFCSLFCFFLHCT